MKSKEKERKKCVCDINGFTFDVLPFLLLQTCIYYNDDDDDDNNGLCVAY